MGAPENVTFYMWADDTARLYINGELRLSAGSQTTQYTTVLPKGSTKLVVTFMEWTGWQSLSLRMGRNTATALGAADALPWSKITPQPLGAAWPVALAVNGVAAVPSCTAGAVTVLLSGRTEIADEPAVARAPPAGVCPYIYSRYRTPVLFAPSTQTLSAPGGITGPDFKQAADSYSMLVRACA